jgi:hypothetical protein
MNVLKWLVKAAKPAVSSIDTSSRKPSVRTLASDRT